MTAASDLSPSPDYPAQMRREDWAARLTDVIAGQVRRYRVARDMTAQQVVDECIALGLPMKRSVLVNLEHGRRGNVTLAELIILAKVLDVHPVELVFPLGRSESVEVLPDTNADAWDALQWFTGESGNEDTVVQLWREHARYVELRRKSLDAASKRREAAKMAKEDEAIERQMRESADRLQMQADMSTDSLRSHRRYMRKLGITPPAVSADIAAELGEES